MPRLVSDKSIHLRRFVGRYGNFETVKETLVTVGLTKFQGVKKSMNGANRQIAMLLLANLALIPSAGSFGNANGAGAKAISVVGGEMKLNLEPAWGSIISITDASGRVWCEGGLGLQFFEWRWQREVPLKVLQWRQDKNKVQLEGVLEDVGVKVNGAFICSSQAITIRLKLHNVSPKQQLLEIRLRMPLLCIQSARWSFFDGREEIATPRINITRKGLGGLFPLTAICDDASGIAVGINPSEYHSWLCAGVRLKDKVPHFFYAVRRVLDKGQSEPVTFVLFSFKGRWGTAMAVERYYDLFPESFRVARNVDPHFKLVGGYVFGSAPLRWEESRRLFHGWQPHWGHKRTGDWMPDERYWKGSFGDLESHLRTLRKIYTSAVLGNAMTHYLQITQCEAELAEKVFPEAILITKRGRSRKFLHAVPILRGEACYYVFPFANRLYEEISKDVPRLITELGAGGIYFDNAGGTMRHYGGESIRGLTGRAFDDDGEVYITSGIAIANVARLVHSTRSNQYFAGVSSNYVGTYAVARPIDTTIGIEGTPWERPESVAVMRRLMGQKTLCWWEDHLPNVLRWRALTPAQIIEAMRESIRYCLLYGLRWGVLPAVHVQRGRAELVKYMPLLIELVQAGWRAVVPVHTDERLWLARYGKGLKTKLVACNPKREPIRAMLRIDNRFLGDGRFLFAYHERTEQGGRSLKNEVRGHETVIELKIEPKGFRVLSASFELTGEVKGLVAYVRKRRDEWERIVLDCDIVSGSGKALVKVPLPVSGRLKAFERNGKAVDAEHNPIALRAGCALKAVIEDSIILTCPKREIVHFPFMEGDKPEAVIVMPNKPSHREEISAKRLSVYFEYWLGRNEKPSAISVDELSNPARRLKVTNDFSKMPMKRHLVLVGSVRNHPLIFSLCHKVPKLKNLSQSNGSPIGVLGVVEQERRQILFVASRRPNDADTVMLKLLSLLDEKYPSTWGIYDHPMTRKAKIAGREFTGMEKPPPTKPSPPEPKPPVKLPPNNLLRNGGFEDGEEFPAHWRLSSPSECKFSDDACEGKRAVFLPHGGLYWYQNVKVKAGTTYRFSVWRKFLGRGWLRLWWCEIRKDGTEGRFGRVDEQCIPKNDLVPDFLPAHYFCQQGVWRRVELTFKAPHCEWLSLRLAGSGRVLLDAATLMEVAK